MELDQPHIHPHPQPNPHHRKIELQSPLDLTFLQQNLSITAQQKLDLHFPPSALLLQQPPAQPATFISLDGGANTSSSSHGNPHQPQQTSQVQSRSQRAGDETDGQLEEHDPLRAKVQHIVSSFLQRTWSGAAENITINGLDAASLVSTQLPSSSSQLQSQLQSNTQHQAPETQEREGIDFTYAPYDARLQGQVAGLYGELEALTAQVAKLRREAPSSGAQKYVEELRRQLDAEEKDEEVARQQQQPQARGDEARKHATADVNSKTNTDRNHENILDLQTMRDGYHTDMRSTYERGVQELARLAGVGSSNTNADTRTTGLRGTSLTETMGKVQRARTVALEFE